MGFFERFAKVSEGHGIEPCSQKMADIIGTSRAALSAWNKKRASPKGETVAVIADKLGVSTDYLLCRTDDPTDYTKKPMPALACLGISPSFVSLFSQLDSDDRLKIEGIIRGMLMADKYTGPSLANAAHIRTDVQVTGDMIAHDENIMNDDNF